jgi:hypothetical protein
MNHDRAVVSFSITMTVGRPAPLRVEIIKPPEEDPDAAWTM